MPSLVHQVTCNLRSIVQTPVTKKTWESSSLENLQTCQGTLTSDSLHDRFPNTGTLKSLEPTLVYSLKSHRKEDFLDDLVFKD